MRELMEIKKALYYDSTGVVQAGDCRPAALSSFATNTLLNTRVPPTFTRLLTRRVYIPSRMLALPFHPTSIASHQSPETVSQYRPAKDIESFNKLLPPVVEFVEGSSSGTLLIAEGRYEPVNGSPKAPAGSEVTFLLHLIISCRLTFSSRYECLPRHLKRHTRIPILHHRLPLLERRAPFSFLALWRPPGPKD